MNRIGIVVHHSAGKDSDELQADDIWRFHTQDKGWCFSPDTEVLTDAGWMNRDELSRAHGETVRVYTVGRGFTDRFSVVRWSGQERARISTLNYSGHFSMSHRLWGRGQNAKEFGFVEVRDAISRRSPLVVKAAVEDSGAEVDVSPVRAAFLAAFVADGSMQFRVLSGGSVVPKAIEFAVSKQRKVDLIRSLFEAVGVEYSLSPKRDRRSGASSSRFMTFDRDLVEWVHENVYEGRKKVGLPWWVLRVGLEARLALVDAYVVTDGVPDTAKYGRGNAYRELSTTVRRNLDVIQAVCHLSGLRTKATTYSPRGISKRPLHRLSINERDTVHLTPRNATVECDVGDTWSVDTGGELILIRHGGCVQVTSNSNTGYHCVVEQVEGHYVAVRARPERMPGAHCKGKNYSHLGICLVGDFTSAPPPKGQLDAAADVLADWCAQYGWSPARAISPHRDHRSTECPGDAFPFEKLVQMVGERL